jgi:hypothetical protein
MAKVHYFTEAQREVMRQIASGMIIRKDGHGFSLRNSDGRYIGKASIAVKSLGRAELVANTGDKIYFTTRGYHAWFGGEPKAEAAELCKKADERLAYVKSMIA